MIRNISKALISSVATAGVVVTTIFGASVNVIAGDYTIYDGHVGEIERQEKTIGLGESAEFDVPQETVESVIGSVESSGEVRAFREVLDPEYSSDEMPVYSIQGEDVNYTLDAENKQFTVDGTTYDITGLDGIYENGEYGTRYSYTNRSEYYTEMPELDKTRNDDNTVLTITEDSGKTVEDLGGLKVNQYYVAQWFATLNLSDGNSTYKTLDIYTGKFIRLNIQENMPAEDSTPATDNSSANEAASNDSNSDSSSDNVEVITMTREEAQQLQELYRANSTITTGQAAVSTTMEGLYTAKSVAGAAITTPKAEIGQALGLKEGETAKVTTWDITSKSSPYAYASLLAGAESVSGELGPAVQVNILKDGVILKADGTIDEEAMNMSGTVNMTVGIPASFLQDGAVYAVAHVLPGGKFEILKDTDNDPRTVSFPVSAGYGAYALVRIK